MTERTFEKRTRGRSPDIKKEPSLSNTNNSKEHLLKHSFADSRSRVKSNSKKLGRKATNDEFKTKIDQITNYLVKPGNLDQSFDLNNPKNKVAAKRISEMKFTNDIERSSSLVMNTDSCVK